VWGFVEEKRYTSSISLVCFHKNKFLETIFFLFFLYLVSIKKINQRKVNSSKKKKLTFIA